MSEHIQDVDPRVYTASRFFTMTFWTANLRADRERAAVIVASSPSGTLATIIPIPKTRLVMAGYPIINPATKNIIPSVTAITVIY